jgi:phosphoribosyl 1,2-cyclic phosphodiesterase
VKISFWGTRGSIPVPGGETTRYGGNTACVEVCLADGKRVIIDAGTGIRNLGAQISEDSSPVDVHLLISHVHWDHIIGFPFFAPIYQPGSRITIDGFPTCMNGLKRIFDNNMGDGFFPVAFQDLKADIRFPERLTEGPVSVGDAVVDTVRLAHPQGGFGFRIREGESSMVFITDNELGADPSVMDQCVRFCEGAGLLIHDSQYLPGETPLRKGWGHSDYEESVDLASRAGVEHLVLFHHDPGRTDERLSSLEAECRGSVLSRGLKLGVSAAKEGVVLTV